jgi:hypothetical protein
VVVVQEVAVVLAVPTVTFVVHSMAAAVVANLAEASLAAADMEVEASLVEAVEVVSAEVPAMAVQVATAVVVVTAEEEEAAAAVVAATATQLEDQAVPLGGKYHQRGIRIIHLHSTSKSGLIGSVCGFLRCSYRIGLFGT